MGGLISFAGDVHVTPGTRDRIYMFRPNIIFPYRHRGRGARSARAGARRTHSHARARAHTTCSDVHVQFS